MSHGEDNRRLRCLSSSSSHRRASDGDEERFNEGVTVKTIVVVHLLDHCAVVTAMMTSDDSIKEPR